MPIRELIEGDLTALTAHICNIPSVSGGETQLADAIAGALGAYPHLAVLRDGDAVVARTHLGAAKRVVIAGCIAANSPDWFAADFAVLCEPTSGQVEGGCNGTRRAELAFSGHTAPPNSSTTAPPFFHVG